MSLETLCSAFSAITINENRKQSSSGAEAIKGVRQLKSVVAALCDTIYEDLGPHQGEAAYQASLAHALRERRVLVTSEKSIPLVYRGKRIGSRRVDLILDFESGEKMIMELKSVRKLSAQHRQQLEFYMHHFEIEHGFLVNFPSAPGFPKVASRFTATNVRGGEEVSSLVGRNEKSLASPPELVCLRVREGKLKDLE